MNLLPINFWGTELSIDEHLYVCLEGSQLPFEKYPARISSCFVGIVIQGDIRLEIDCVSYILKEGMILSVFPMEIVELIETSNDLRVMYFTCSAELLNKVLFHFPAEFEMFLKEYPTYTASEKIFNRDKNYIELIKERFEDYGNICRNEILLSHIRCFFLEIYNNLHHELLENPVKNPRRKEIMKKFMRLVFENFKYHRDVAFYADKLNITPKYLSMISMETNGKPAKRIIDDYIVTEIKLMLKISTKSIQEITVELNFPDQSFTSKYFKKHTGFSPKQYRNE